jgi:hypothetical protein
MKYFVSFENFRKLIVTSHKKTNGRNLSVFRDYYSNVSQRPYSTSFSCDLQQIQSCNRNKNRRNITRRPAIEIAKIRPGLDDIHKKELLENFENLRAEVQTFKKLTPLQ